MSDILNLLIYNNKQSFALIDRFGNNMSIEQALEYTYNDYLGKLPLNGPIYITKNGLNINYSKHINSININFIESEVIQFSVCKPSWETIVDTSELDEAFPNHVIDDKKYWEIEKKLNDNPKYIKNPNYIKNGYEHGRIWYEPVIYTYENGIMLKYEKVKELTSLYLAFCRYIRKYGVISENKQYYILPNAYKEYLDGVFIPCNGAVHIRF